jgi:hypothetical protein
MSNTINANQLQDYVGKEVGLTDWITVDQERINQFAEATWRSSVHSPRRRARGTNAIRHDYRAWLPHAVAAEHAEFDGRRPEAREHRHGY